jgi:hypothetical protein
MLHVTSAKVTHVTGDAITVTLVFVAVTVTNDNSSGHALRCSRALLPHNIRCSAKDTF